MTMGFMGIMISGCALDSPVWFWVMILVLGNLVMMAAGQRLLDNCLDDGFVEAEDAEQIEEALEQVDEMEYEFKIRSRRNNCFEIWSTEVRGY